MTEKKQLLRGILDFLDESVILPPGDWARGNLLPISQMMKVRRRRRVKNWKPGGGDCGQACIICGNLGTWFPGTFFPQALFSPKMQKSDW